MSLAVPEQELQTFDWPTKIFSVGVCLLVFGLLNSVTWFWAPDRTFRLLFSGTYSLIPFVLGTLAALAGVGFNPLRLRLDPLIFGWGIVLVFISDWLCREYSFFTAPSIRGEILLAAVAAAWLLRRGRLHYIYLWLPLSVLILLHVFFSASAGRLLFSDDHSVFFHRLLLLKEAFPGIPFYYPFWNGGIDARAFFATGALNLFFLGYPFFALFEAELAYNLTIALILFLLTPGAMFFACRLSGTGNGTSSLAALLALAAGLFWYRWALSYGTMGFVTSTALMPLNLVLAAKVLANREELHPGLILLFFFSSTLMLLWPFSAVVFIPVALMGLVLLRRVLTQRWIPLLLIALLAANAPWMALFWSASNVGSLLVAEQSERQALAEQEPEPSTAVLSELKNDDGALWEGGRTYLKRSYKGRPGSIDLQKSLRILREATTAANPLILFLAIPGLLLLPGMLRWAYALSSLWLLVGGTLLVPLKPQLELDRLLVMLTLLWCLPAAWALQQVFRRAAAGSWAALLPAALMGGFILIGPLAVAGILNNRSLVQYRFLDRHVGQVAEVIKQFGGTGRIAFSGCVVHELGGGHLAPLTQWTRVPLLASSYVHDIWWYQQLFPPYFLSQGDPGIKLYLDLHNVAFIFAHEPSWRKYFTERPDDYQLVWKSDFNWSSGPLHLYERVDYKASYVLEGQAEISTQESTYIEVLPHTNEVLLKFNHYPFLKASGCLISGKEIAPNLNFIQLSDCTPGTPVKIQAISPGARLLL